MSALWNAASRALDAWHRDEGGLDDAMAELQTAHAAEDSDVPYAGLSREALESIAQYGSDTLSGRADGPDDRDWQREAVKEMTRRARAALKDAPIWKPAPGINPANVIPDEPLTVDDQAEFEVYVGDDFEASTSGPRDRALAEARHYALQYAEDGDVRIEEITRRLVETLHSSGTSTEREKA